MCAGAGRRSRFQREVPEVPEGSGVCAGGGSRGRFRRVPESSAECRRVPGSSGAGVGLRFRRVPASSGVCWCRFQRQVPEGSGGFRKVLEGCGKFRRVPARAV